MSVEFRVVMTDPAGVEYDLTSRTSGESVADVTEETEQDLLQARRNELTLRLRDEDGSLWSLLSAARRGDVWEVIVERAKDGGPWTRVFGGALDIPLSVRRNTKTKKLTVRVYDYGAKIALTSAETLQRTFTGRTASITSGLKVMTFTAGLTTDLVAGDSLTLGDATSETFVIATVDSTTQVTTVAAASSTFTSAAVTLATPYYRSKTVSQLVDLICDAAGFHDRQVDIAQELSAVPFPSALNTTGLASGVPNAVLERSADVTVYLGGNRQSAATPSSGFGAAAADTVKSDWRPYATSEPGTLRAANTTDEGKRAWDYAGNNYYECVLSGLNLNLHKNGVFLVTVATKNANDDAFIYSLDVDNVANEIWVGYWYARFNATPEFIGWTSDLKVYNSAGAFQRSPSGNGGYIRAIRSLSLIAVLKPSLTGLAFADPIIRWDQPISLYTTGTTTVATTLAATGVNAADSDDRAILWTLRAMGSHLLCVRRDAGKTYVAVWNQSDGTLASDHLITAAISARNIATVYDEGGTATNPHYLGYAGGTYFTVSKEFSSVIPYADFDGLSCEAALVELAKISGSHLIIDEFGTVKILGRKSATLLAAPTVELTTQPLEQDLMPISEWYRRAVRVTAKTEAGADIDVSAGNTGDSGATLEIELKFPATTGLCSAIANAYYQALVRLGQQSDEEIVEPDSGPLRLFGLASRDDRTYRVTRSMSKLMQLRQQVQLVEEAS